MPCEKALNILDKMITEEVGAGREYAGLEDAIAESTLDQSSKKMSQEMIKSIHRDEDKHQQMLTALQRFLMETC